MVHFRKRLNLEIVGRINQQIVKPPKESEQKEIEEIYHARLYLGNLGGYQSDSWRFVRVFDALDSEYEFFLPPTQVYC